MAVGIPAILGAALVVSHVEQLLLLILELMAGLWIWFQSGPNASTIAVTNIETVRNLSLALSAPLAAFGLWLAWKRTQQGFEQNQQQSNQVKLSQEGQISDRFQKAVEMLYSEHLTARLAAIAALEQIRRERLVQYHVIVMQIFCDFINNPPHILEFSEEDRIDNRLAHPWLQSASPLGAKYWYRNRPDIDNILKNIGSRGKNEAILEAESEFSPYFNGSHIVTEIMSGGNFDGTIFVNCEFVNRSLKSVSLNGARFFSCNLVKFDFAFCSMEGAFFIQCPLDGMHVYDCEGFPDKEGVENINGNTGDIEIQYR